MRREAVVKDYFYPSSKSKLLDTFTKWGCSYIPKKDCFAAIVPHAGYIYSGEIAFKTLSSVNLRDRIVLMGPNHTGFGQRVSVYPTGSWETPFGDVEIDGQLVDKLVSKGFNTDTLAHMREHSLEVIVPIIKYLDPKCKILPITISFLRYDEVVVVAKKILEAFKELKDEIFFVISSDFNHFENEEITMFKDKLAIDAIMRLDPEALYNTVKENDISMCGVIPTAVALIVAKEMGVKGADLLFHSTSGAVTGDYDKVVGYAGILIG